MKEEDLVGDQKDQVVGLIAFGVFERMLKNLSSQMRDLKINDFLHLFTHNAIPSEDLVQALIFIQCCRRISVFGLEELEKLELQQKLLLAAEFYAEQRRFGNG